MDSMLKGNYEVEEDKKIRPEAAKQDSGSEFEARAMDRLGGSIAFVMKGKKLVWDEDDEEEKG